MEDAKTLLKNISLKESKIVKALNDVSGHIEHTIKINNHTFTSTTRMFVMGSTFKVHAQDTDMGTEHLFTNDAMKAMKGESKYIKPKEDSKKRVPLQKGPLEWKSGHISPRSIPKNLRTINKKVRNHTTTTTTTNRRRTEDGKTN